MSYNPQAPSRCATTSIVGGGSAGCVIANCLSEDPGVSVLLLQRCDVKGGWFCNIPLLHPFFHRWVSLPCVMLNTTETSWWSYDRARRFQLPQWRMNTIHGGMQKESPGDMKICYASSPTPRSRPGSPQSQTVSWCIRYAYHDTLMSAFSWHMQGSSNSQPVHMISLLGTTPHSKYLCLLPMFVLI